MGERAPNVSPGILAAAVSMAVLGGCAVSDHPRPTIERVAAGEERVVFAADVFRGTTPERVKFTDIWQREEYVLFRGGGAQAARATRKTDPWVGNLVAPRRPTHPPAADDHPRRLPFVPCLAGLRRGAAA